MDTRIKNGHRQQGKIPPEDWRAVQEYRQELQSELKRLEEEEHRRRIALQPPRLYGYIRCSHQDSEDSGKGIEAQHGMCTRWADFIRPKYPSLPKEITWIEDIVVSAFKVPFAMRKGGGLLHHALKAGDHVIFAYHDRAFRNTVDCLTMLKHWKSHGIGVHFADIQLDISTAQGEMFMTMLAAVAQMESGLKSERVKEVFRTFKDKGRLPNGHAPMGFKLAGKRGPNGKWMRCVVVPDLEERRIMGEIVRVRDRYGWSFHKISDYVEEWLANQQSRQATPAWEKRLWNKTRCFRAYKAELAIRAKESGSNGSGNGSTSL